MKLDAKDWKILYSLDKNARRSDAEIGKEVGLSREVVSYRIKKLVNSGVIKDFITLINSPVLGFMTFRIHFKFNSLTKKREEEIKQALMKGAFWLVKVRGPWDYNCMAQTKNYYSFKNFLDDFRIKYGKYIEEYEVSIVTRMNHYKRSYLVKESDPSKEKPEVWGGEIEKEAGIKDLDIDILKTIENNARMSSLEIAKKCETTDRIVRYRIKRLIEKKIIMGFRSQIDINKIGKMYFKIRFWFKETTPQTYKKLQAYLLQKRDVVYGTEAIGGADYEIEIQVSSTGELYKFIDDIREKFEENIVSWKWMEYIEEAKLSYLYEV